MAHSASRAKAKPRRPLIMSRVEPGVTIPRSPWEDIGGYDSTYASATALSAAAAAAAQGCGLAARLTRPARNGPRLPVRSLTTLRAADGDAMPGTDSGYLTQDVLRDTHRGRTPGDVQVLRLTGRGLRDPVDSTVILRPYAAARCLDAEGNRLTLAGVRGCPELHTLSLACNNLRTTDVPGGLARWFPALRLLDLSLNALPSQQLSALGSLPELAELRLSGNGLASLPRDLATPGSFPRLRVLLLDRNRLREPAELRTLSRLPLLQRLALDYNPRLRTLPCLLRERPVDVVDSVEFPTLQKKPSMRQTPRPQQSRRRHRQQQPPPPQPPMLEVPHAPFPRLEHLSLRGTAMTRDADVAGSLCWPRLRVLDLAETPLARASAPALGPVLARLFLLGVNVHKDSGGYEASRALGPRFRRVRRGDELLEASWRLPRRDSAELQALLDSLSQEKEHNLATSGPERGLRSAGRLGGAMGGGRSRSCSARRAGSGSGGSGGGVGGGVGGGGIGVGGGGSGSNSSGDGPGRGSPRAISDVSSRESCCSDPGVRHTPPAALRPRRRAGASSATAGRNGRDDRRTLDQLQLLFERARVSSHHFFCDASQPRRKPDMK